MSVIGLLLPDVVESELLFFLLCREKANRLRQICSFMMMSTPYARCLEVSHIVPWTRKKFQVNCVEGVRQNSTNSSEQKKTRHIGDGSMPTNDVEQKQLAAEMYDVCLFFMPENHLPSEEQPGNECSGWKQAN